MTWQLALRDELVRRLPESTEATVKGSVADAAHLDGWSDLDLEIDLAGVRGPLDLLADRRVWAASEQGSSDRQVLRVVFTDGRRLDLAVTGGSVHRPAVAGDNDVRFLAALAAAKLGRGDHLIGLHLTLELMRSCLVQAMLLRDRDQGTSVHRFGSSRDALAHEVAALLRQDLGVVPRPNVVERTVAIYARWRQELEPGYEPDWSGLEALIDRGLRGSDSAGD